MGDSIEKYNQLNPDQIAEVAAHLESAELEQRNVANLIGDYPAMTWKDAYDIQWAIRRRKEARGHEIVGLKMGLTSRAKMAQMGVESPCYGFLADYFSVRNGGDIDTTQLVHPKVEAEIGFVTNRTLRGPDVHIDDVRRATQFVVPVVEVVDSRYSDVTPDIKSVVADNTAASRFITGSYMADISEVDLAALEVELQVNDEVMEVGVGAAVLGHPAESVAILANMLAERGEVLAAGTFVMTGAITAAVVVEKGDTLCVRYQGMGTVTARFV